MQIEQNCLKLSKNSQFVQMGKTHFGKVAPFVISDINHLQQRITSNTANLTPKKTTLCAFLIPFNIPFFNSGGCSYFPWYCPSPLILLWITPNCAIFSAHIFPPHFIFALIIHTWVPHINPSHIVLYYLHTNPNHDSKLSHNLPQNWFSQRRNRINLQIQKKKPPLHQIQKTDPHLRFLSPPAI